jgi:hypothetical protein
MERTLRNTNFQNLKKTKLWMMIPKKEVRTEVRAIILERLQSVSSHDTIMIIRVISNVMKYARNIWKFFLQNKVKMKNKFVSHKITLSLSQFDHNVSENLQEISIRK